jgi:chemotaxis protein MotB
MGGKPKLRKESADESQELTFISLMLLLFCFMVIMVSLAQLEGPRFRKAIGSVRGAFSILRSRGHSSMVSTGRSGVLTQQRSRMKETSEELRNTLERMVGKKLDGLVEVEVGESGVSLRLGSMILYEPGGARLKPEALPVMQEVAAFLSDWPGMVRVIGHTDDLPIRTAEFPSNWDLSVARAGSVARYLEGTGIEGSRLIAEGVASTRPLRPNDSRRNRETNRRVEILLEALPSDRVEEGVATGESWFVPARPLGESPFAIPGEEWVVPK